MLVIISDKPNFYKTNLFNHINKTKRIFVIYVGEERIKRDEFFYSKNMDFDYVILFGNKFKKILQLIRYFPKFRKNDIIVSGWDNLFYLIVLMFFRTSVIVESTSEDKSRNNFFNKIKYMIKKIVLAKVEKFICAGYRHTDYVKSIYPNKKIIISNTVGFPFLSEIESIDLTKRKDFVYIGRNSSEKNIGFMIDLFNKSSLSKNNKLYLVGDNFQEYKNLSNIEIIPKISRDDMANFLRRFHALILTSKSESYGLVIEESFRCGIPAIISSKCGIIDTLAFDGENSIIIDIQDIDASVSKINRFFQIEELLVRNIKNLDFSVRDYNSVKAFYE